MAIRILCVDDEQSIQELVSLHMELQGFEVKTASDGKEALKLLEMEAFDLVLLDIDMPKMNGIEVLRQIKIRGIQVHPIMLTGADSIRALNECAQWGAFDYLPKPYNFHELVDSIDRALASRDCLPQAV